MTGLEALNLFMHLQALVAVSGILAFALRWLGRRSLLPLRARSELRLHYLLLALLPLALFLPSFFERGYQIKPFARVIEAGRAPTQWLRPGSGNSSRLVVGEVTKISQGIALEACAWLLLAALLLGVAMVVADYVRLHRALGRAIVFRRMGRVRIALLDGASSPFSVLGPRSAWVVLPPHFLHDPEQRKIAVAHELQHHRSGDTLCCHLFAPLRALCFFHPLRSLWGSVLAEIQELACDEALVSQKKVSVRNYSLCLVSAAETAVRERGGRAYAAAPSLFSNRRLLHRRIETMQSNQKRQNKKWVVYAMACLLSGGVAASAWASGQWVADSRIQMADAEKMVEEARKSSDFPVAVNEKVLKWLHYYLGTTKGRVALRSALANLEALRPRFETHLRKNNAPEELLAVGLIESGYRNLPAKENPYTGAAGIWQFIASTARVFGMRVDDQVDERLDIDLETDAAFRYLVANKIRFNDWLLGVMAYNMGERALDAAIAKSGTRDPWELVKRGYENDSDYLPKFMAALLILKNPQALK
jgi:membrane-bound lytic murein transglycosylase D